MYYRYSAFDNPAFVMLIALCVVTLVVCDIIWRMRMNTMRKKLKAIEKARRKLARERGEFERLKQIYR